MQLEFECGKTISTYPDLLGMALKAHLKKCDNPTCNADVRETMKQYGIK